MSVWDSTKELHYNVYSSSFLIVYGMKLATTVTKQDEKFSDSTHPCACMYIICPSYLGVHSVNNLLHYYILDYTTIDLLLSHILDTWRKHVFGILARKE